ncbi:MAG: hypothetical protein GY857_14105 [Desulfobacula sp.]|nr:hypothetical protein [Desulfobacula sp.]
MKKLAAIILILSIFFIGINDLALADSKNKVVIFEYDGISKGDTSDTKFSVFKGILKDKISDLERYILHDETHSIKDSQKIYVNYMNEDTFTTKDGVLRWLKNQSSVLCLLRGTIVSDDNVHYIVKSHFYLGELKGDFPYDVIKISLPVSSKELGNTQDSHSIVILYALAMESRRIGMSNSKIAKVLFPAIDKLADIKRRGGLSHDLVKLESVLMQIQQEMQRGGDVQ